MSFDFMRAHGVAERVLISNKIANGNFKVPVIKDRDWLKLPDIHPDEQKLIGLYAIHPGSNFIALQVRGAYTVDWGDGVIENFNNNAVAQHEYSYDGFDPDEETKTNRGYKQVLIVITPQSGQSLTHIDLHRSHSIYSAVHSSGFVDITVNAPFLTSFLLGSAMSSSGSLNIRFAMLERFRMYKNAITDLRHLFYGCLSLRDVFHFDATTATNCSRMFSGCHDLRTLNLLNTGNVSNFDYMFQNCYTLEEPSLFDTSNGTRFIGMFMNCHALKKIPLYNTAKATQLDNFLYNCHLIETTPVFNTSNVTGVNDMFRNCYSLLEVPEYDFGKVTSANNIFVSCMQLYSIRFNNMKRSFSIAFCKLSSEALNDLYGRLGTVSNQAITVVGNYGVRADSTAPAVAKGWIVSG